MLLVAAPEASAERSGLPGSGGNKNTKLERRDVQFFFYTWEKTFSHFVWIFKILEKMKGIHEQDILIFS